MESVRSIFHLTSVAVYVGYGRFLKSYRFEEIKQMPQSGFCDVLKEAVLCSCRVK